MIKKVTTIEAKLSNLPSMSITKTFVAMLRDKAMNSRRDRTVFPKRIGEYTFVRKISPEQSHTKLKFGLYKNPNGDSAISKQWGNSFHDFGYYSVINEARVYMMLGEKANKRTLASFNIKTPELIDIYIDSRKVVLLMSRVSGISGTRLGGELQIKIYKNIFYAFKKIRPSKKITVEVRRLLHIVLLFPLLLLIAFMRYPLLSIQYIRSAFLFALNIWSLCGDKKLVFTHRDLVPSNILMAKNKICVLDFQTGLFAHPAVELAETHSRAHRHGLFNHYFLRSKFIRATLKNKKMRAQYTAILIYTTIQRLATSDTKYYEGNAQLLKDITAKRSFERLNSKYNLNHA